MGSVRIRSCGLQRKLLAKLPGNHVLKGLEQEISVPAPISQMGLSNLSELEEITQRKQTTWVARH